MNNRLRILVLMVAIFPLQATLADAETAGGASRTSLDKQTQDLKSAVLDLNRELFLLEEELLFPSNMQVAVFVSMDVGEYFALDSV